MCLGLVNRIHICSQNNIIEFDVSQLTLPTNSPDLNVIKKIWDAFNQAIKRSVARPQSLVEWTHILMDELTKPLQMLSRCVWTSWPVRSNLF
ncbi:hypothetical protein AVEN_103211-1 [Araneus ventricosus]|uniref:Tc1-like transposase DDE domain-containing protein n=1 Tax=Araneus ventricosus TaxID=182803 RepID=A0A4Y2F802_ARAVE|nr:hypothetical protein AVEN_103211-1 [Araneus ventricosus]